jgi:hypothetical protein
MKKCLIVFTTCLTFLVSCKENTVVRKDIVPEVDNITVFGNDTTTILAKTVKDDSVKTSLFYTGFTTYLGAGNINNDPVFGKSNSEFYFQIKPNIDNYNIDQATYQIDSAILILPYSGFTYGDTLSTTPIRFEAFRITESFSSTDTFYAHSPAKSIASMPFAVTEITPKKIHSTLTDSVKIGNAYKKPHIRLKISDDLLNDFKNNLGGNNFANAKNFKDYFNGICIKTSGTSDAIPYFRLNGDNEYSRMNILFYYHTKNASGAITDTLTGSLFANPGGTGDQKTAFFTRFTRNYAGTPVLSSLESSSSNQSNLYVQNLPGVGIEITIPNLNDYPTCIVNKAELVINVIESPFDNKFSRVDRLYPEFIDDMGIRRPISDRLPLNDSRPLILIDGYPRIVNVNGSLVYQYVLNLPREFQNAINNKQSHIKLRLNGTQSFIGANRTVLAGSNYTIPAMRMKLNLVYTKL